MNMFERTIKRSFDIILSLVGILILLLPGVVLALIIKLDSKGSVFFTQRRTGKNQKVFNVIKFRTMEMDAPSMSGMEVTENNPSITRVGGFLRKYSIDELPQLFNIFMGDMTIVGPRPEREVPSVQYRDKDYKRFEVKPGITGLAQVSGRNNLDLDQKRGLDVEYVNNYSLLLDLKILFRTIKVVVLKEGIYTENHNV